MKRIAIPLTTLLIIFTTFVKLSDETPDTFRVVLDPGHGGIDIKPWSENGDRYEQSKKNYLAKFRSGAAWRKYREAELMYSIAVKAESILKLTETATGFIKFSLILEKYGIRPTNYSVVSVMLSRPESISEEQVEISSDPNAPYRIFDYPSGGKMADGRLTRINRFKPHLVMSLHCDYNPGPDHRGFAAIIAPDYNVFADGFDHLKNNLSSDSLKYPEVLNYWLTEDGRKSNYFWYKNDCSIYFTGYRLHNEFRKDDDKFLGFKHNMVKWAYSDTSIWPMVAPYSPAYAAEPKNFKAYGRFWERERSIYEKRRRSGGTEGFGGDNNYASMELIRYILCSLQSKGFSGGELRPVDPYMSAWTVPILVNAISAYVELGYLKSPRFRSILSTQDEAIAEGVAVAAYSLLAPTTQIPTEKEFTYKPKGKRIDLSAYTLPDNRSYFDAVSE